MKEKVNYQTAMLRPRSLGLMLLLATLVIYLPATLNRFVDYDDPQYVVENPFVNQGLSVIGLKWAFANAHESNWHPLTWISHMVDCDLFRLNPAGPHLVNILLHAANAALLFTLILRLTGFREDDPKTVGNTVWPAAFISALFAWHPLHVESVAWVSERKDVLSTFFTLLSLLSYARYAEGLRAPAVPAADANRLWRWHYWLALTFFLAALLSKPMPVTLPLVMLLLDFWPLKRLVIDRGQIKSFFWLMAEKIPFCLLSMALCVITLHSQHLAESSLAGLPPGIRLQNAIMAYAGYLGKMIWPLHLCIYYPMHPFDRTLLVESILILAGISAIGWLERKDRPWLIMGWLWFVITLLPVIGLVQVGSQALADRYTYFPLIGIFLALSFSLASLVQQFPVLRNWMVGLAILVLVLCIPLTEKQLTYWHDSTSLFSHALDVEPSEIAYVGLGGALHSQNRIKEAMAEYIMAWRLAPDSVLANINIAGILAEQTNKLELAAYYYQRVMPQNNWMPLADCNYGRVLVRLKRYDDAIKQFAAAEKIDPLDAKPHYFTGEVLLKQGHEAEAVKEFQKAIKLQPQNIDTLLLTANILASSENSQVRNGVEALALATKADRISGGGQADVLDILAMADAEVGKFGEACVIEEKVIKLFEAGGQKQNLDLLHKRLEIYEKHQPWRESFKQN